MANKREIKKYAEALGASICESMMVAYYNVDNINKESVEEAIAKVLGAVGAAKCNANKFFGKGSKEFADKKEYLEAKRAFFKELFAKVITDYNAEIDAAMKIFNGAIPESVKATNKELAAE